MCRLFVLAKKRFLLCDAQYLVSIPFYKYLYVEFFIVFLLISRIDFRVDFGYNITTAF